MRTPTVPWAPSLRSEMPGDLIHLLQELQAWLGNAPPQGVPAVYVIDVLQKRSGMHLDWEECAVVVGIAMELQIITFEMRHAGTA